MIMKKAIWIDDNESAMKSVVSEIFEPLWKKDIKSEIYIFGDEAISRGNYDRAQAIDNLNVVVYDKFITYLIDSNLINDDKAVKEKWKLINSKEEIGEIGESDVAKNKKDIFEKHKETIQQWKDFIPTKGTIELEGAEDIVNDFVDNTSGDETVFLIDLCLIEDDLNKLKSPLEKDETLSLLSMELYHFLKQNKKYDVFLYSSFVVPDFIINNWKNSYQGNYGATEYIEIYGRDGRNATNPKDKINLYERIEECFKR